MLLLALATGLLAATAFLVACEGMARQRGIKVPI
jgi:hypothetical protein